MLGLCSLLFALLGLVFGCIAKAKKAGGMATAGIILSVCGAILAIIWIVLLVSGALIGVAGDYYDYYDYYWYNAIRAAIRLR